MVLAPFAPVCSWLQSRRNEAIRCARTCYNHLAGRLGVDLTRAMLDDGFLEKSGPNHLPTPKAAAHSAGRESADAFCAANRSEAAR